MSDSDKSKSPIVLDYDSQPVRPQKSILQSIVKVFIVIFIILGTMNLIGSIFGYVKSFSQNTTADKNRFVEESLRSLGIAGVFYCAAIYCGWRLRRK